MKKRIWIKTIYAVTVPPVIISGILPLNDENLHYDAAGQFTADQLVLEPEVEVNL